MFMSTAVWTNERPLVHFSLQGSLNSASSVVVPPKSTIKPVCREERDIKKHSGLEGRQKSVEDLVVDDAPKQEKPRCRNKS